ncbi:glycosyltransferase [Trinickia terrae]|uniref:glycosyltransferase n=1 Tax=Trinickia terrae TaxID=2571161 RepID=UPI00146B55E2|nr:glycosyltransferase [Trinickia terrae]
MSGSLADVCILTFAVDRPDELARCIASVAAQRGSPRLRHRVLSERVDALRDAPALARWRTAVEWHSLDGEPFQGASSPRIARLRQAALLDVQEPFVCFLDDDNAIDPDHIRSLLDLIERDGLDAAHSWRFVRFPDGSPFPFDFFPWQGDPAVAAQLYRECVELGAIVPGSPVMRDGAPRNAPADADAGSLTVDMNEWLFKTETLRRIGFDTEFSETDLRMRTGEDDKLYRRFLRHAVRFACTEQPTVQYYLGGVSNLRLTSGPTVETLDGGAA